MYNYYVTNQHEDDWKKVFKMTIINANTAIPYYLFNHFSYHVNFAISIKIYKIGFVNYFKCTMDQ